MPRRTLMRRMRFAPPEPRIIERYLLFFNSKELFCNPDLFPPLDSPHLFGDNRLLQLEIGCGTAEFLCALALEYPQTNFLGIDISSKPLLCAVGTAEAHALPNIKFIQGDFRQMYLLLVADTLQAVYLHFPDPHMRPHFRKRRVVSPDFLEAIGRALAPDGRLSIMTDHHEFFLHMLELIEQDGRLARTHAESYLVGFDGPVKSKFQRLWEGHGLATLRVELEKAHSLERNA